MKKQSKSVSKAAALIRTMNAKEVKAVSGGLRLLPERAIAAMTGHRPGFGG